MKNKCTTATAARSSSSGLSAGAIAGIVVGVGVPVLIYVGVSLKTGEWNPMEWTREALKSSMGNGYAAYI
jgi:hypothetical protein